MNKLASCAFAATALIAMPAFAQAPAITSPAASTGAAMTLQQSQILNLWRASKLDGVNIYNNANEKIGEIADVLMDRNGRAMAIVVDAGGFLGMGEHRVALRFEDVKFSDMPMSTASATRQTTTSGATTTTTTTTGAMTDRTAPVGAPPSAVSTGTSSAGAASNRMFPDHAIVNLTKDQMKALPQISYPR